MGVMIAAIGCLALASLAACGGSSGASSSTTGVPGNNPNPGGGPVGAVTVGPNVEFVSSHNGSQNPAVDTIPVGGTVTWTWSGSLLHSVQSVGSTSFASSSSKTAGTYAVTFSAAGTYQYNCAVHGSAMRGTVVVQ